MACQATQIQSQAMAKERPKNAQEWPSAAPLAARLPAQKEYTAVPMPSTSRTPRHRLCGPTGTRSLRETIRVWGLARKGPRSCSGGLPAVPAQQLSDDVSNVALRRTGPGLVKQAG
jgi:hypothetical protein